MLNWGLGIEHEMRLRFSNKIDISNMTDNNIKIIYKEFGYVPEYLFINSNLLLNLYNKYTKLLLIDYKNNINNKINNTEQFNTLYKYLDNLIIKKKEYPFDDIKFYDINNKENTINYLYYYFTSYKNINYKFLNLDIYFYDKDDFCIDSLNAYTLINFNHMIGSMNLDNIKLCFKILIHGEYEKKYIKILKNKLKISKYNIIEIKNNNINLKIDINDKSSPIINFNMLKKLLFGSDKNIIESEKIFISKFKNNNELLSLLKKLSNNGIPHDDSSAKTTAI